MKPIKAEKMIRIKGASDSENLEITRDFLEYQKKLHNEYEKSDNRSNIKLKDIDKIMFSDKPTEGNK